MPSTVAILTNKGEFGTGFFVSKDGYIATAAHVLEGATEYTVNGKIKATLINENKQADVALLKINGSNFPSVELETKFKKRLGEDIGFVGIYTLKINKQITLFSTILNKGILAGTFPGENQIFVISAFVNHGDSGGPVFDCDSGKVIGLIIQKVSEKFEDKPIIISPACGASISYCGQDPVRLTADLYNKIMEHVKELGETSQMGIGFFTSAKYIDDLLKKVNK